MPRPAIRLEDTLSFRVPRAVGDRLRAEAASQGGDLAGVVREYLQAGIETIDATESKTAGREPAEAVSA